MNKLAALNGLCGYLKEEEMMKRIRKELQERKWSVGLIKIHYMYTQNSETIINKVY